MTTSNNAADKLVYGANLHALRTGDLKPFPVSGTDNGDGTLTLNVTGGGSGGGGATVGATAAGTSASTANPVQGVTNGVPMPVAVVSSVTAANNTVPATNAGTTATTANPVQGVTGGVAMPISVASLPLPAGAATSAAQPVLNVDGGALAHVTNFPGTQPISVVSLPLPAGASQDATVASAVTSLGADGTSPPALPGGATGVRGWLRYISSLLAATQTVQFPSAQPISGSVSVLGGNTAAVKVDGSAVTQPTSVSNFPATQAISAISLPLPSGAAQDGTDATGVSQLTGGVGMRGWLSGSFSKLSSIYTALTGTLTVQFPSAQAVSGTVTAMVAGGNATAVKVDGSAVTQPISAASLPLPSGAAQDGNDATGITPLAGASGIRGWLSSNYSKLSSILAALTGTLTVQFASAQAISGTVNVQGGNSTAVKVDGSAVTQPVSIASAVAVTGTFYQATQPVIITALPALSASTAAIGQVGGKTATISTAPTSNSASAYVAGYVVGGLLTFANATSTAQSGMLQSVALKVATSLSTVGFKVYLFNASPASTTFTDHAALAINSADYGKLIDVIILPSGDIGGGTGFTTYNLDGIGKAFKLASTSLYAVIVTTGAPTFTTTTNIVGLDFDILQD